MKPTEPKFKSHAREGRGAGNGYNENWYNSPLWDNIRTKKAIEADADKKREEAKERAIAEIVKDIAEMSEEQKLKEKQKKMFAFVN